MNDKLYLLSNLFNKLAANGGSKYPQIDGKALTSSLIKASPQKVGMLYSLLTKSQYDPGLMLEELSNSGGYSDGNRYMADFIKKINGKTGDFPSDNLTDGYVADPRLSKGENLDNLYSYYARRQLPAAASAVTFLDPNAEKDPNRSLEALANKYGLDENNINPKDLNISESTPSNPDWQPDQILELQGNNPMGQDIDFSEKDLSTMSDEELALLVELKKIFGL